jgi:hypothetical protein
MFLRHGCFIGETPDPFWSTAACLLWRHWTNLLIVLTIDNTWQAEVLRQSHVCVVLDVPIIVLINQIWLIREMNMAQFFRNRRNGLLPVDRPDKPSFVTLQAKGVPPLLFDIRRFGRGFRPE